MGCSIGSAFEREGGGSTGCEGVVRVDIRNDENGFFVCGRRERGDTIGYVPGLFCIECRGIELSNGFVARMAIHTIQRGTSGKFDATDHATHSIMVRKALRGRQRIRNMCLWVWRRVEVMSCAFYSMGALPLER